MRWNNERNFLPLQIKMTSAQKNSAPNLLQALYENLPIGVCVIQNDRFLMVNKQFESITGLTSKKMLSSGTIDLLLTCFKKNDRKKILSLLNGTRKSQLESSIVNNIGVQKSIRVVTTTIKYTTDPITIGYFLDITSLQKSQDQLQIRSVELEAQIAIANILVQAGTFEKKVEQVLKVIAKVANSDIAALRVPDEIHNGLRMVAAAGTESKAFAPIPILPYGEGLAGQAFITGKPVVTNNYSSHSLALPQVIDTGLQSVAVLPIKVGNKIRGVLHLNSWEPNTYTKETMKHISGVADAIGALLENARLTEAEHERSYELSNANQILEAQANDLARSNADLEQFAYVASHDLQEPLRVVSNYVQLLANKYQSKLDTNGREFIQYALDASKQMYDLINDLLSYSQIGHMEDPIEMIDSESSILQAISNLQIAIKTSQASITYGKVPKISANYVQITQVIQNLLSNAIKFRGLEPPRIHIEATPLENRWLFSFSDNGIGIEPRFHDRIFLIFQRLHGRSQYSGTGVGLPICKKIIERHGGNIWVESQLNSGSVFQFTLPK